MLNTIEASNPAHEAVQEWPALPEQLGRFGTLLMVGDAAAALACIALLGLLGNATSAFLALACTFALAVAAGRYRLSYALHPRDEWYQAGAVAIAGGLVGLALSFLFGLHWLGAIAGPLVWIVAAGAIGAGLHRLRRGERRFDPAGDRLRRPYPKPSTAIELGIIRLLDVLFASLALLVCTPLLVVIALAIRFDDAGPVFFQQRRVGRDDDDFTMFKFRTMRTGAGDAWVRPGDERITRRGALLRRWSLDELPQLCNIALGEMSLVGPRPEMREYADRFAREVPLYSLRHVLRPGLTGWAQLNLPRNLEPADAPRVLACDLFYVEHVSVYLYLYCVIKTACEFFTHRAV
ncbi:MAG TPA: sugar transferase [Candidatus Baltobacteraceae bacterium]|nr:sugar transferase [Candidatus Baltobacteraceae bacterium]